MTDTYIPKTPYIELSEENKGKLEQFFNEIGNLNVKRSQVGDFLAEHDFISSEKIKVAEKAFPISPGQFFHEALDYHVTHTDGTNTINTYGSYTDADYPLMADLLLESVSASLYGEKKAPEFTTDQGFFKVEHHQYSKEEAGGIINQILSKAYKAKTANIDVKLTDPETGVTNGYQIRLDDIQRYLAGRIDGYFFANAAQAAEAECSKNPSNDACKEGGKLLERTQIASSLFAQAQDTAEKCGHELRDAAVTSLRPIAPEATYYVGADDARKLTNYKPKSLKEAGADPIVEAGKCLATNTIAQASTQKPEPKTRVTGGEAVSASSDTPTPPPLLTRPPEMPASAKKTGIEPR